MSNQSPQGRENRTTLAKLKWDTNASACVFLRRSLSSPACLRRLAPWYGRQLSCSERRKIVCAVQ